VVAPRELWPPHEPIKKTAVQVLENLIQIIELTLWGTDPLASSDLTDQMGFLSNVMARNVSAIADCMLTFNLLAIELGQ
jgi:hypothetical protein